MFAFFTWLQNLLVKAFRAVVSVPGMIATGFATAAAAISAAFSNFTLFDGVSEIVQSATQAVQHFGNIDIGPLGAYILYSSGASFILKAIIGVVGLTVGLTACIFGGLFVTFIALLPEIVAVWAIRKAINLIGGGLLK
jgi:hypothetical protein